jgi:hypothetical protein
MAVYLSISQPLVAVAAFAPAHSRAPLVDTEQMMSIESIIPSAAAIATAPIFLLILSRTCLG